MQPAPPLPNYQAFEDANHLRYLAIAHYVIGGLTGLVSCLPIIHMVMGGLLISGSFPMTTPTAPGEPDIRLFGWLFVVMGGVFVILGWTFAVLLILTGRWLSARKNHTFCFVMACLECASVPLGTVLGIFTILVISRPSVKALFLAGPHQNNWTRE